MHQQNNSIKALLNLLEDEDRYISTVAMEQLLLLGDDLNGLVAEFQESHDPRLRSRVHQLASIMKLRKLRAKFIENIKNSSISLWDGILQINFQYNQKTDLDHINKTMASLVDQLPRKLSTAGLTEFMSNENFSFGGEDIAGSDLYLVEDVLLHRIGSSILLSVIAKELGEKRNLETDIILYKGSYSLVDRFNNLINPAEDWKISHLRSDQDFRLYEKMNVWLALLSQLFIATLLDGRLQAIHRVGSILGELCGGNVRRFPFPLGR